MPYIKENLGIIKDKIGQSALKAGVNAESIKLVAVTKNVDLERIKQAIDYGVEIIGENKVQETLSKFGSLSIEVEKHLIGHLQTNKVKKAISLFDMIQSVDSLNLAEEISKKAGQEHKKPSILIEVNTSREKTKFGVKLEDALPLIEKMSLLENIKIKGLMTVGLWSGEEKEVRPCFVKLRNLFEKIKGANIPNVEMKFLSMGMTNDFEWAILEGSNMVRIGTGIFGSR